MILAIRILFEYRVVQALEEESIHAPYNVLQDHQLHIAAKRIYREEYSKILYFYLRAFLKQSNG